MADMAGSRAQAIGKAAYVQGRVGGIFDTRILKTERSYNYKLAATWMTAGRDPCLSAIDSARGSAFG